VSGERGWDVPAHIRERGIVDPAQIRTAIAVGDFTSNGNLDVPITLAGTNSVSIFLDNGDGTFQPATTYQLLPNSAPDAICPGSS
jgi:hypothetical protein